MSVEFEFDVLPLFSFFLSYTQRSGSGF
jgi:hypothetical protein